MSDEDKRMVLRGEIRLEPDSLQGLIDGVVEGIAERLDRRTPLPEEAAKIPKAFIVGHKVVVPRLNGFAPIAEKIAQFSKLEEASKDVAVYRINRVSLWKAAELGLAPDEVIEVLKTHSPTPPLKSMRNMISRTMSLYGALTIEAEDNYNVLRAIDEPTMDRILAYRDVNAQIYRRLDGTRARIVSGRRAEIKRLLMDKGYPVKDYGLMEEFDQFLSKRIYGRR